MSEFLTAIAVILLIVAVAGIGAVAWFFGTGNSFVAKGLAVDTQWAQVENQYQRRYDLIPNLVNTVKGYMKYEGDTLSKVTALRSQWGAAQTPDDKIKYSGQLEAAISKLLVVMENYPDLKANTQVTALMDELAGTENRIAVERMRYNQAAQDYNTAIKMFPGSIVAGMYGLSPKALFSATEGANVAPQVNFTV